MSKRSLASVAVLLALAAAAYLFWPEEPADEGDLRATGPLSLHGAMVSVESISQIGPSLRREKGLRELGPIESFKSSNMLSGGAYFFIPERLIERDAASLYQSLLRGIPVSRFEEGSLFEVYKHSRSRYTLIGYASGDSYFAARELDGQTERALALEPRYSKAADYLVQVPLHRVVGASYDNGRVDLLLK
ncbi:MAG: hypothetical protein HZA81_02000 [Candidatus Taylorbacteria bacterium]|nr:hypothetical protein [Candidatus Taylorbacteria bacterium]